MDVPPLTLDRESRVPLAVQLADGLRAATADGTLRRGDRLPSTRALAALLGVSRTVTAAAYDQLLAEGWVEGRQGVGTFVIGTAARPAGDAAAGIGAPTLGSASVPAGRPSASRAASRSVPRVGSASGLRPGPAPVPTAGSASATVAGSVSATMVGSAAVPATGTPPGVDLRAGAPCLEVLTPAVWRRAWRAAADAPPDLWPDPAGDSAFRLAVAEHLLRHRGLPAADVLGTAGSTAALAEIAAVLPPGCRVAVEEPGYQRAVGALRAAGLRVVGLPVDDGGLVVDAVPTDVAAVYCTPAHQFPLGARLSARRRVALVERARTAGFWVVEDDYDGELRYDVAPLPLLASIGPDVVAHLGTTSKIVTPTLGAGWLVAPPPLRAAVLRRREETGDRPPRAGQRVLAAMAASGDLARHLRRLRRELAERRRLVLEAVAAAGFRASGDAAGAHVVVRLPDAGAERAVLAASRKRGVRLDGLARHHLGRPGVAGIVLGYAAPARAVLAAALPVVVDVLELEAHLRR